MKKIVMYKNEKGIALVLSLALMALLAVLSLGLAKSAEQDLLVASVHSDIALTDAMADRVLNTHLMARGSEQQRLATHTNFTVAEYGAGLRPYQMHMRKYNEIAIPYMPFQNNYTAGSAASVRWPGAYEFNPWGWNMTVGGDWRWANSGAMDSVEPFKPSDNGGLLVYRTGFRATPDETEIRDEDFGSLMSWGVLFDFSRGVLAGDELEMELAERQDMEIFYGTNSLNGARAVSSKFGGRYLYYAEDESIKIPVNNYVGGVNADKMVISLEKLLANIDNGDVKITASEARGIAQNLTTFLDNGEIWDSWEHIYNSGALAPLGGLSEEFEKKAQAVKAVLTPFSARDSESFYNDHNDVNRFAQRYYLGNLPSANVASLVNERQPTAFWNDDRTRVEANNLRNIQWLSELRTSVTGFSDDNLRYQVAANLIDYSDSDSAATIYPNGADYPVVCGLEMAPYIDRVEMVMTVRPDPVDPSNVNLGYIESIELFVGLVNLYGTDSTTDWLVEADLSQFNGAGQSGIPPIQSENVMLEGNGRGFVVLKIDSSNASNLCGGLNRSLDEFTDLNWGNIKFSVKTSDVVADISWVNWETVSRNVSLSKSDLQTARASNGATKLKHGFYFYDPRANTNMTEQTCDSFGTNSYAFGSLMYSAWTTGASPSLEEMTELKEGQQIPIAGIFNGFLCDFETSNDYNERLSTAFIRNNTINSLWELGLIHRGEPFRTLKINLAAPRWDGSGDLPTDEDEVNDMTPAEFKQSKFGMWARRSNKLGGQENDEFAFDWSGFYEDGDGRILDQVKTLNLDLVDPVFNPFANNPAIWQTVLSYFRDMHEGDHKVYGYMRRNLSQKVEETIGALNSDGLRSFDSYLPSSTASESRLGEIAKKWAEYNPFYLTTAANEIFHADYAGFMALRNPASLQSERSQLCKVPFVGMHDPNGDFVDAFKTFGGYKWHWWGGDGLNQGLNANGTRYDEVSRREMRLPGVNSREGNKFSTNYTDGNLPTHLAEFRGSLNDMFPRVRKDAALEELCGKIADIMSFRRQYSRMIVSVQKLEPVGSFFSEQLDRWERQGKQEALENYVKYGVSGKNKKLDEQWFQLRGEYKQMNILKYDLVTGEMGVVKREIQE